MLLSLQIIGTLLALLIGLLIGASYHRLTARLDQVQEELKRRQTDQAGTAIVETTPQLIRQKIRKGEGPADDSAIVTIKTPQEIRQAKDLKLKEELDQLSS